MRDKKVVVKEQVELFDEVKQEVFNKFMPDLANPTAAERFFEVVDLVYQETNDILVSEFINDGKQSRMEQIQTATPATVSGGGEDVPPTTKQIDFATKLGIQVEGKGYTRKSLSKVIDEEKKKQGWKA